MPDSRGRGAFARRRAFKGVLAVFAAATLGVSAAAASGSGQITIPVQPRARVASANPFKSRGMWIWVLGSSNGGRLSSIISQAHHYGIGTLYIKSSDGTGTWSQFSSATVSTLKAHGINVCGWQFVYGSNPRLEAQAGANAVRAGANCLVIDAEGQYEGKYWQAQAYIQRLRQLIGTSFPVALAGLPYIDYHPAFPYSVFLGPGGAQYNAPQMYWRDIGTSVDGVYAHTYLYNRAYLRPIYPLGQVYNVPPPAQVRRFRQFLHVYGAPGVSWWDWQEAGFSEWKALSQYVNTLANASAAPGMATISKGAAGDLVVWAQEHLAGAGASVSIDGGYGSQTVTAVASFQLAHRLTVDGVIGSQTWGALLQYKPVVPHWTKSSKIKSPRVAPARALTAADVAAADNHPSSAAGPRAAPGSSLLAAKRYEIPAGIGAGRP